MEYVPTQSTGNNPDMLVLFDKESFIKRMGNRGFVLSILEDSLKLLPEYLETLRNMYSEGNMEAIYFQAHKLKGMVANINADALRNICFEVENAAKEGDEKTVSELFPILDQIALLTVAELSSSIKNWNIGAGNCKA